VLRPPAAGSQLSVPARGHHRRGLLLVGLGAFQLWLWGTRVVNLLGEADSFSAAFVAVHLVLYVTAIGAGVLLLALGWRLLRESSGAERGQVPTATSVRGSQGAGGAQDPGHRISAGRDAAP
jgi:hypothetical protein